MRTVQRTRSDIKREKTRVALVKAAHWLMSRRGVDAVSLQQITVKANVGAGTFYNYFTSKDDIAAKVLDCYIANLTHRQEASVGSLELTDPAAVIAVSTRSCLRELLSNPLWFWWLKRPDKLSERMRAGFRRVGHRELEAAITAGRLHLPHGRIEATWSMIIWQLVGGARDIIDNGRAHEAETAIAVVILQGLGFPPAEATNLCRGPVPPYPDLPIDFSFTIIPA